MKKNAKTVIHLFPKYEKLKIEKSEIKRKEKEFASNPRVRVCVIRGPKLSVLSLRSRKGEKKAQQNLRDVPSPPFSSFL